MLLLRDADNATQPQAKRPPLIPRLSDRAAAGTPPNVLNLLEILHRTISRPKGQANKSKVLERTSNAIKTGEGRLAYFSSSSSIAVATEILSHTY